LTTYDAAPRLIAGRHAIERDGVQPDWRRTDGDALWRSLAAACST